MPLKIRDCGLKLEGAPDKDSNLPSQAFAIALSDHVIEDMIQCVQNGDSIQLALGASPAFLYGSQRHTISRPDSYPHELYLTRPFEHGAKAEKIPHSTSLFEKPARPSKATAERESESKQKAAKNNKSSGSSELESDIEALQNGLAAHAASKEKTRMMDKLPTKGSAKAKGKLLPAYSSAPRSLPTSPAIHSTGLASPTPALSASQQQLERAKEQRVTLVHELAVQDQTLEYLKQKWVGREEEMRPTLEKVADYLPGSEKWAMKKAYWRELDVWNYDYDTQELRQKAIDNAVRQYDRQRLSASEPEWTRLLPKDERKGNKCLSRLQSSIAKGPPPPSIKVQKADGGSTPKGDSDVDAAKQKVGGESMARSSSNPLPSKSKKTTNSEAQVKRLFGNSKAKTATSKASTAKAPAPKVSPTKAKVIGSSAKGGRILSQEIIENSDSSGDETLVAQPKAKPKPVASKVAAPPAEKIKDTVVARARPLKKEPVKPQVSKRSREDDDSSSSSGTPLSKRIKPKNPLPSVPLKHRPSDASQHSRGTTNSSLKSKNTSPTKSSPLASSPPTNASDLENEAPRPVAKKRKAEDDTRSVKVKRAAVASLSNDLMHKAHKFKVFYEKYEALHYEVAALDNPPNQKLADLLEMRHRLSDMKKEIYRECPPERA